MATRKRRRKSTTKSSGGTGLKSSAVLMFLVFSAILLVAVMVGQLTPLQALMVQENAVLKSTAQRVANQFEQSLAPHIYGLRSIADDPRTRELILSADSLAISNREQELKGLFPNALRVRLLKSGVYSPDKSSEPHLGFACLDLQRTGEKEKILPPVEMHVMGTPQQHIDIVQPVLNTDKQVIGHVQLNLDVALVPLWIKEAAKEGYVELAQKISEQKTVLLAKFGNAEDKTRVESLTLPVSNTAWQVSVWLPGVAHVSALNLNVLFILGLAIFLTGMMIFVLTRSLGRTIVTDLENFMLMEASVLRGNSRHQYHLHMKEFRTVARRLQSLPDDSEMERERDDDPDAVNVSNMGYDPMYMDKNALAVEELDDDEAASIVQQQQGKPTKKPDATPQQQAGPASNSPAQAVPQQSANLPALPPAEIFKAYDIRGIVGKTLTAQYAMLIGQALGSEAISRGLTKIAFARDGRLSGPELGGALVRGLQSTGIDVVDVGMVPTPVLYYAAAELTEHSGVMLTGSHNPPDYNGFKMVLGGETLSGDTIQALRKRIESNDFSKGGGNYATKSVVEAYIKRIASDIKIKRKLKVIIDCGNGVAGAVAPQLFRALGCEVVDIYSDVDGTFPNHHPDPSRPENLRDLIELVRAQDADVGLAFDGDGDRLGVVSSDGSIIYPDRLMMLFAADVLSRNHGAQIIYDIKCSSNLTRAIWEKGGEPLMWKTGHSLIKAKMKQSGALLAGEMSGHIFFKERWYGFDDGLYSGARLLEILSADSRTPREIFSSLPDAVNTPELNIGLKEGEQHSFIDALLDKVDFPDANVIMIDGLRADFENGWGLVRASNTTPCLVLRFEGKDQASMEAIQEKFKQLLLEVDPELALPF